MTLMTLSAAQNHEPYEPCAAFLELHLDGEACSLGKREVVFGFLTSNRSVFVAVVRNHHPHFASWPHRVPSAPERTQLHSADCRRLVQTDVNLQSVLVEARPVARVLRESAQSVGERISFVHILPSSLR